VCVVPARTDASTTKLLSVWPTTARQYLTLFSASICVPAAVIKSPFHATGSAQTAVGLFLLLVRRSGTYSWRRAGSGVTDSHWRHFYFCSTSVFSALEVCYSNALYKFTFDISHLTFGCVCNAVIASKSLQSVILYRPQFVTDLCQIWNIGSQVNNTLILQ